MRNQTNTLRIELELIKNYTDLGDVIMYGTRLDWDSLSRPHRFWLSMTLNLAESCDQILDFIVLIEHEGKTHVFIQWCYDIEGTFEESMHTVLE